jgi:hypothetical protein
VHDRGEKVNAEHTRKIARVRAHEKNSASAIRCEAIGKLIAQSASNLSMLRILYGHFLQTCVNCGTRKFKMHCAKNLTELELQLSEITAPQFASASRE